MEENRRLLLCAKCEDGENIHVATEWDKMTSEQVIGVFAVLGAKIASNIAGAEGARKVYESFERIFRNMQDREVDSELRKMIEEE